MTPSGLPIDEALPALRAALRLQRAAVLQAPPGAGKSTVVPLALLDEPWLEGRRIIVLEPRRLAARAVATRMAATLGEPVGRRVGYRMRLDTRVSRETRIEVVTEGVLARLLHADPALEDTAALLFDEFHERSLNADLGLALALDARATLRPDLRIVVMSATLDGAAVAALIGDAPVVTAPGRQFEVQTRHVGRGLPLLPGPVDSPERAALAATVQALHESAGDALVFLPGAAEIRRLQAALLASRLPAGTSVHALYGELSAPLQAAALAPARSQERRVVLATNIAETSLTIPGVRIVIDTGLERRSLFDPATGMSRLETRRISRASADQRRGRAGRTANGVCYRLWSEGAHRTLAPFTPPEIVEADLAPLALELAAWGAQEAASLAWLDAPPAPQLGSARALLRWLGAIDDAHRITPHGRGMAQLAAHPRLAHMLLRAAEDGAVSMAADLAAMLGERDLLRGQRDADVRTRLELLRAGPRDANIDRGTLVRARRSADQYGQAVRLARPAGSDAAAAAVAPAAESGGDPGELLALAFPDRIGRRRESGDGRYTLSNGRGAHFRDVQTLSRREFIVAVDLDDEGRDARILLAAPLSRDAIDRRFADIIEVRDSIEWDARTETVIALRRETLGELVLSEQPLREPPADAVLAAMLRGIRTLGIAALPWTREARDLQARIAFARSVDRDGRQGDWADLSDASFESQLGERLAPWLAGMSRRSHLDRLPMAQILAASLTPAQRRALDELAPTHLTMPTGSRIRIDYGDPAAPTVAVRLQEVFGLADTPRIGGGRIPITFTLLSPAQRPVQITRELASFWRGAYAEVRKDMRGRYPRHYWPENPLEAEPTRGVRRRN